MKKDYVIGVDFGSDSARALVIDAYTGHTVGEGICYYPRWRKGLYQDMSCSMFRQHPLDYMESLTSCVKEALDCAGQQVREHIVAIAVDTTGSTPSPVDREGVPLSLKPEFAENPNGMFHLWKDHTAIDEAKKITKVFSQWKGLDYTKYQGNYASEWFWAKIMHTVSVDEAIEKAAYTWVEHSDWIVGLLAGVTEPSRLVRGTCAAGHKAYWHSAWNGLPARDCLASLHPYLTTVHDHYTDEPKPCASPIGTLSALWANTLGLSEKVVVAMGSFDAHAGAVGAGVCPKKMVLNIGTSAVNMLVAPEEQLPQENISYVAGAAENSILPNFIGLESSQASFGDAYAWLTRILVYPMENMEGVSEIISLEQQAALKQHIQSNLLANLEKEAAQLPLEGAITCLDWFNGRRYPHVNEQVKSAMVGLHLGTSVAELYQGLVLSTAFGQRMIMESLRKHNIEISTIVAVGGIAQKSAYVMQTLSNALNCPIDVSSTVQACARGAAIYAAVAAGLYPDVMTAQKNLCEEIQKSYTPDQSKIGEYEYLYEKYCKLASFVDPIIETTLSE